MQVWIVKDEYEDAPEYNGVLEYVTAAQVAENFPFVTYFLKDMQRFQEGGNADEFKLAVTWGQHRLTVYGAEA
jgi:hypothetical protein